MVKATGTSKSVITFVQVQTLRGTQGTQAAYAEVEKAVAAYNKANPKAQHVAELVTALANNTKGMQYQLALLATLARAHGATMIRLGVHNGHVAICGPKAAVAAVQDATVPAYNYYNTAVSVAYSPSTHGNRVGFTNGWLCGAPAGLAAGLGITATLAYGLGFLFTFPAPGTGDSYAMGHAAAQATAKADLATFVAVPPVKTSKAPRTAKPAPTAAPTVIDDEPVELAASVAA